jgi:hypothetical protein
MLRRRDPYLGPNRRRMGSIRVRRLALVALATGFMLAAEALATHGPATPHSHHVSARPRAAPDADFLARDGEPQLPARFTAPGALATAAARFVRDYAAWEAGRLPTLPGRDAAARVIELLEHAGRHGLGAIADLRASVRLAFAGAGRYVVTSAVGNFLLGQRGSRWLVVSVPGD